MLAHQLRGGSHSSRLWIAPELQQPTRAIDAKRTCPLARACRPYSALLRVGFAMRAALPKPRCALTAPFHPCLISRRSHRRYALCGTFPRLAPGGRYPPPSFRGARTFLDACAARLPSPLASGEIGRGAGFAKPKRGSGPLTGVFWKTSARRFCLENQFLGMDIVGRSVSFHRHRLRATITAIRYHPTRLGQNRCTPEATVLVNALIAHPATMRSHRASRKGQCRLTTPSQTFEARSSSCNCRLGVWALVVANGCA